ncbi:hypothetical protein [Swingsia samuiensis]|uniref:Uncharacterized protein n=1 Tax=Swingsia samuiensis TaxID=1293412 RepID=A0A4Y6UM75_9PROT|nr:hypothetical protein [Swingsia samuiensis]QDH17447.1 hypothetical protein E3D00_07625 [Swingsia samuiensis]
MIEANSTRSVSEARLHTDILASLRDCHFYNGAHEIDVADVLELVEAINDRGWSFIRMGEA